MEHKAYLLEFFLTHFPIFRKDEQTLNKLLDDYTIKTIPKKTQLLRANQIEQELRFINKGIIREYYATPDKEVNINFYDTSAFITDFLSFYSHTPSKKYQECLTDVELLVLPRSKFEAYLNNYENSKVLIESYFKKIIRVNEIREYNMITKKPDVLYKEIIAKHPQWIQLIPQYHIASYLRISPETLSRIRKRTIY